MEQGIQHQLVRFALSKLGTDEFVAFTNFAVPKCCVWRKIRDAGLDAEQWKRLGIWIKTFVWQEYLKLSSTPDLAHQLTATPSLEEQMVGMTWEQAAEIKNQYGDALKKLLAEREGDEGPSETLERIIGGRK